MKITDIQCHVVPISDRDGYLDLVGTCNKPSPAGEPKRIVVWHGGPDGFKENRRQAIHVEAEGPNVVADFNRDGHLDIAVGAMRSNRISILWGSAGGYAPSNKSEVPFG